MSHLGRARTKAESSEYMTPQLFMFGLFLSSPYYRSLSEQLPIITREYRQELVGVSFSSMVITHDAFAFIFLCGKKGSEAPHRCVIYEKQGECPKIRQNLVQWYLQPVRCISDMKSGCLRSFKLDHG
jgi:hypothetical protein